MRQINADEMINGQINPERVGLARDLIEMALALLTAKTAREPMTLEELRIEKPFIVWVEDLDTGMLLFPVAYIDGIYRDVSFDWHVDPDDDLAAVDYGKRWRCWAMKPTEEDRRAVEM